MENNKNKDPFKFLHSSSEMSDLIRKREWSKTPLGSPDSWPAGLRNTLSLMLSTKFPMFLWWGEELIQFYNDAYRPLLGSDGKHPEALGQNGKDCWPEVWEIIRPLIQEVLQTGNPIWSENQLIPIYRNGTIEDVYWTFSYSPVRNDQDHVQGILVTCNETTKSVNALEENKTRFFSMADASDILIATSDITSNATYFNEKWIEMTGRNQKELLEFGWADLIHPDDRQNFLDIYLSAFAKQEAWRGEFRILNAQDRYRWLLASGARVSNPDGSFNGYISSSVDITEKIEAALLTEKNEQNLRSMVMQAPIGICVLNAETLVSEIVNDSFLEVAGKPYEKIYGQHYWDSFAEVKEYYEEALQRVVKNGVTYRAEEVQMTLIRHGQPEDIFVTFVYAPLLDAEGKTKKVVVWVLENTLQVQARQKVEDLIAERTKDLKEANEKLLKSNAELNQFAYIASHDLQEPLRKISILTEMLESKIKDNIDAQASSQLSKIKESSVRMGRLIRDVLSYSELDRSSEFSKVDLSEVLQTIKSDYELLITEKKASIQSDNLPVIYAIPLQMTQLFSNLIGNALKFSKSGGKTVIRITVHNCTSEEIKEQQLEIGISYIKLIFADNGIGIPEQYINSIFDIFQRLHGKSEFQGTGIGLAMCKKIALNHKGVLDAEGSSSNGAVFNIYLPGIL